MKKNQKNRKKEGKGKYKENWWTEGGITQKRIKRSVIYYDI